MEYEVLFCPGYRSAWSRNGQALQVTDAQTTKYFFAKRTRISATRGVYGERSASLQKMYKNAGSMASRDGYFARTELICSRFSRCPLGSVISPAFISAGHLPTCRASMIVFCGATVRPAGMTCPTT